MHTIMSDWGKNRCDYHTHFHAIQENVKIALPGIGKLIHLQSVFAIDRNDAIF